MNIFMTIGNGVLSMFGKLASVFDVSNFLESLPTIGLGMLGIFIVTFVIIIITSLLNKATENKE